MTAAKPIVIINSTFRNINETTEEYCKRTGVTVKNGEVIDKPRPSWDEYFLNLTFEILKRSEDLFIKHGAVLVKNNKILSCGYNGLPKNFSHDRIDLTDRDFRRHFMIHAEINSILQCEVPTIGSTIYISGLACNTCLLHIIGAGIKRIVYADRLGSITEDETARIVRSILIEQSGIEMVKFDTK